MSPFRPTVEKKGANEFTTYKTKFCISALFKTGSAKTHWQCGQQAKDNPRVLECQCDIGYSFIKIIFIFHWPSDLRIYFLKV